MTVIPFAPVASRSVRRRGKNAVRSARLFDLLDLAERARLKGKSEQADRFLLAAWSAYDGPAETAVSVA